MTTVREFDPGWQDDDLLLDDLARAVRATEGMRDWVARLGKGSFAWHDVDEDLELVELLYDSALNREIVARHDDVEDYRTLLFEGASGSVQIEKTDGVVNGQLIPAGSSVVSIVSASGTVIRADVDEVGFFRFRGLPDEPLKLRWRTATRTLVSDWFHL